MLDIVVLDNPSHITSYIFIVQQQIFSNEQPHSGGQKLLILGNWELA